MELSFSRSQDHNWKIPASNGPIWRGHVITNREGPILLNSYGEKWTPDGFRTSWRKAVKKAGIIGVTFNDLRGTAITRLAVAGCTEAQIASISGHTLTEVRSILDKNYLHRDIALSTEAITKLERARELPK